MRRLVQLLSISVLASLASSQCTCDPGAIQINQGTPPENFTFAPISFIPSSEGCDITVHCVGYSPMAIGTYFSSTVEGNTPILDSYNTANLAFDRFGDFKIRSFDFNSMRCVNGIWIPYIADIDYLALNDPSDPDTWITYNNIFCTQPFHPTLPPTTTVEEETSTSTPSTTSTTKSSPTTTSPATVAESYCNCGMVKGWFDNWEPSEIWVDLVIIIDTSASMGDSLDEATSLLTSFIPLMSTDTTAKFYSRIGVIAVADTIEVVYNLNMSSSDNLDSIKQHNVEKMDVGAAFQAALKMFADGSEMPSFRKNAKQIIYYLTNSAPGANMNGVETFKTGGGIIIVNDFVLEGDVADPGLKKLASDKFFFTHLSSNYLFNLVVLCDANCFCKPSLHAFNDDEISPRTQANRGCFHPVNNGIPQPKARETCQKEGGSLVSIHDQDKEFFVNSVVSVFGPKKKYWLGLQNDGNTWNWDDKSTASFSDWDVNQPDTNGGKLQCAYATQTTGLNVRWTAANCAMGGVIYVCESAPCSTGNTKC